ncbi:MAG: prephenate dehydrogenase/arogenate dehydrogenase family protein [endosymbiont of Galathealinum brachiosum]|uniref:prephenate dehydrogenase n=1 Tax=endosymbiont of Galathealinum brachiosum TaxID=2200906 RepID=A0A370DGH8_9GAMM|nr:MAG: prephenate dehydrogenase/arogenate dehydrogenase family protein [endosymbiont of Galathealinum brachiosum]
MINHLCVIGVGLIGGSLALALKKSGYVKQVTGMGRSLENLQKAEELGVIDQYETDYAKAISQADMVFVAVPIGAMPAVFKKIEPHLRKHTIVTDGGSAKHTIIDAASEELGVKVNQFIPGHPIAGTEKSGAEAAFDSLYSDRRVILTPLEENSLEDVKKVRKMWEKAGAEVDEMGARHHDLVLAGTSHLPHVLAFALVDCLNNVDDVDEIFKYAAGGFRDFTRIASSDPVMWRDICVNNSEAILAMMQNYQQDIDNLKKAIQNSDSDELLKIFSNAKKARDTFCM